MRLPSTESFQCRAERGSGADAAGHGDGTHRNAEKLVDPEEAGKTDADKILHNQKGDCTDCKDQAELAALFQDRITAGESGTGEEQIHKEVLKNAVHLNGKSVGLYTDENENAADQTTDYGCGDKVFLEKLDFAFDEAAEKEYQYSETYGLDDVEFDDHGNCLL